jgi:hypothetical protein
MLIAALVAQLVERGLSNLYRLGVLKPKALLIKVEPNFVTYTLLCLKAPKVLLDLDLSLVLLDAECPYYHIWFFTAPCAGELNVRELAL